MPYYRRNLYVLWIAGFLASSSWTQVIPFIPLFLKEDLGLTDNIDQWSGIIFSMHFMSAVVMQPFWGKISDRYGRKLMVVRAGFFLGLIYFGLSMSTLPWHLAFFRFLNGALTGFIPGSIALIATNTPEPLAARYVASAQTANATGSIFGPAIGGLLAELFGFRGAMRVSGVLVLLSTLLVLLLVREHKKGGETERTTLLQDFQTAFRTPVLTGVMGVALLATLISTAFQPFLTLYLEQLQVGSRSFSGLIFSLPGLAFVVAATRWVNLAERMSYAKVVALGLAGCAATSVLLAVPNSVWLFAVIFFLNGIFLASLRPATGALIATHVVDNFRGRAYGMQQSAGMLGGLIAPLLAGFVGGHFGTKYAFVFVGLLCLIGYVWIHFQSQAWGSPASPTERHVPAGTTVSK